MGFLEEIIDKPAPAGAKPMSRQFIANVFSYMFSALTITGVTAWVFANDLSLITMLISETGFTTLGYIVMFAPLGIALMMQMAVHRFSVPVLLLLFIAYSVLLGMSLSFIFLVYSLGSIATVFGVTAITFGVMAVLGYTTKQDLTSFGRILYMAFIGIFVAAIVNMFLGSSTLDYIISMIGVLVFTGLTAYKMQELKYMSSNPELSGTDRSKLAIIGGLQLYILFINLFLSLLRLMGGRD